MLRLGLRLSTPRSRALCSGGQTRFVLNGIDRFVQLLIIHFQQVHGFMAARGDLKDPAVEADYKKAYQLLLNFFHENLYVPFFFLISCSSDILSGKLFSGI